jgi:hypothetical protein
MKRPVSKRRRWRQQHWVSRAEKRQLDRAEARGQFVRFRMPKVRTRVPKMRLTDLLLRTRPVLPPALRWDVRVGREERAVPPGYGLGQPNGCVVPQTPSVMSAEGS